MNLTDPGDPVGRAWAISEKTLSNPRPLRFGILGCGTIAPTHAGALAGIDDARLLAVADVLPDRAGALAEKFNLDRVYDSAEKLIADDELDAICVCTPSGMHADHAVAAMEAGKHVLVEKPMEITLGACDRMIEAARRTGRTLSVVCQHRFDDASMLVKDAIDAGKLGAMVLATADVKWWRTQHYYDSGDWRGTFAMDGGGALMNQGVHTVDLLRWLAGDVKTVFAHVRTAAHERIEVEDVAVAALTFANGAVGTLTATTAAYDGLPVRIDLFGTLGSAILEGDRLRMLGLKTGESHTGEAAAEHAMSVAKGGTASVRDQAAARSAVAPPGAVWGDAHRAQIRDFIHAATHGVPPIITGRSARKAVAIILAVYESSRTGKVVELA